MKKLFKVILVAIPALVVAAAVGTTTIGCGDDTTTPAGNDLSGVVRDMAGPVVRDMATGKKGD
jgi:hypothetical protein